MAPPTGSERSRQEIDFIVALGYDYPARVIAERFNKCFNTAPLTESSARYLRQKYSKAEASTERADDEEEPEEVSFDPRLQASVQLWND